MKDIEKTSKKEGVRHNSRKTRASALLLTLSMASCGTPTAKDVEKDLKKIEVAKQSIRHLVNSHEDLVKKYNELVRQAKADPDNKKLQEAKNRLFVAIKEREEKIAHYWDEYFKRTDEFDEDVIGSIDGAYGLNQELPENTYQFMLDAIK